MNGQPQEKVIAFLSDGANLPGHAAVEVIRTHGAVIFLSGPHAYKIKRDVRYDYLDFSTLDKRRDMLLRELELNASMAPSIYRDVVAVTRDEDGRLHLGGAGDVVEWVLRMHRFDAADELDKVAECGALDDRMAQILGEMVARYHGKAAPRTDTSGSDLVSAILVELTDAFATMRATLDQKQVKRFAAAADRVFRNLIPRLNKRGTCGHVRRCHGDLHLRNIVLIDGVPTPFDALEFDEALGTCDVLYDLAFLLMDLRHKGLTRAANIVLSAYLFDARDADHYAALSFLPLFLSIRAAIRAMVAVQTAPFNPDDAALLPEAHKYLSSALSYLDPAPAQLIAIGGLSGTGKTVLAKSLACRIGAAPGAVHLRSDLERKALFDVSELTRLPPSAYDEETSARVYRIMRDKAGAILSAGHSVIMDATWLSQHERASLPVLAEQSGARFTGLWLTADAGLLQARVSARRNDASDADAAVVRQQAEQNDAPRSWAQIDASGSPGETLRHIQSMLPEPSGPCASFEPKSGRQHG